MVNFYLCVIGFFISISESFAENSEPSIEYVYSPSVFWFIVDHIFSYSTFFTSLVFLFCSILGARKLGYKLAVLATTGSLLAFAGQLANIYSMTGSVRWIYLGGRQPTVDQNPIILFLHLHAINMGFAMIATSFFLFFLKFTRTATN